MAERVTKEEMDQLMEAWYEDLEQCGMDDEDLIERFRCFSCWLAWLQDRFDLAEHEEHPQRPTPTAF